MDIGLLAVAALAAGIAIGLIVRKRRADREDDAPREPRAARAEVAPAPSGTEEFHGLMLEVEKTPAPCQAASALSGRVLRPQDAPQLPLSECDASVCRCLFRHRPEMRRGERRKVEDRRDSLRFDPGKADRRSGKDRRIDVNVWKGRN